MRIALITGGAGGLGLATAQRFARDGMRIVIADLDMDKATEAASCLAGEGHRGLQVDVSDENSLAEAFDAIENELGPVSVVANFAGVLRAGSGDFSIARLTTREWDDVFAINARGSFLCCREMARRRPIRPVKNGRIILISSAAAQLGGYQGSVAYFASKGSILSLTKGAARELAPLGITVNAIAPGAIDTPMLRAATAGRGGAQSGYSAMDRVPVGRVGLPEEIAAAAAYLASCDADYVSGSTLDVNGGLRMQ